MQLSARVGTHETTKWCKMPWKYTENNFVETSGLARLDLTKDFRFQPAWAKLVFVGCAEVAQNLAKRCQSLSESKRVPPTNHRVRWVEVVPAKKNTEAFLTPWPYPAQEQKPFGECWQIQEHKHSEQPGWFSFLSSPELRRTHSVGGSDPLFSRKLSLLWLDENMTLVEAGGIDWVSWWFMSYLGSDNRTARKIPHTRASCFFFFSTRFPHPHKNKIPIILFLTPTWRLTKANPRIFVKLIKFQKICHNVTLENGTLTCYRFWPRLWFWYLPSVPLDKDLRSLGYFLANGTFSFQTSGLMD